MTYLDREDEAMALSEFHSFCRGIRPREPLPLAALERMDPGIVEAVIILSDHGIETCQSCEGGPGHAYPEPSIDFLGGPAQGFAAVSIARQHGLPVAALYRVWNVQGDEITEVIWRLVLQSRAVNP
jgi:hypothetical protein